MNTLKIIFFLITVWVYTPCMAQISLFQTEILTPGLAPVSLMRENVILANKIPLTIVGNDSPSPICNLVAPACTVLPVNLISFQASRLNNVAAKLTWITANEINNQGFGVERSLSPAQAFAPRGYVPGIGNSQNKNDYQFEDDNNFTFTTYYRLKIINTDGGFTYSETQPVQPVKISDKFSIFPNPATDMAIITILLSGPTDAIFVLRDATLRSIRQWTKNLTAGTNNVSFNIQSLAAGSYFIVIHQKDKSDQVLRFFKK